MSSPSPLASPLAPEAEDRSPRRSAAELLLTSLEPGAEAVVEQVEAEAALAERLLDLGFLPGTPVRMVRRAPLGDPNVYELRGYRVCLRRAEGVCVRVRRV